MPLAANGAAGTPQTMAIASATQPVVAIEDAEGDVVTSDDNALTLAISTNPSGGTLSGCSATTDDGVAAEPGHQERFEQRRAVANPGAVRVRVSRR